ncbi:unnamed protein product [Parnassius apollo]|uniref:(apollo) hypothetical protein n=1 Tax=Parnassius apollo TaxID=110799 RepID=A0A8S3WGA8_PARAO|nr:unnamed protein product [Parnassius apollo]
MERRKLLVKLGKTGRQCDIMNREDLLQLIDNNRETSSESPKRPFKEDESLQNISDGFCDKNAVMADEVIEHLIENLDVSAMTTNEDQLTSQDKSPCSVYSRSVTPVHSQSEIQINSENVYVDNRNSTSKLSDTPTPSKYNSFTSSPPRPLSELDQNICLINSGRPSSMSLISNCSAKISHEERKLTFDRFWDLCDHEKQWVFIDKYTKHCMKLRITTENDSKRQHSVNYTLPINLKETSSRTVKVCKTMFKNTLSVSNQFIHMLIS